METLRRPELRPEHLAPWRIAADALLVAGFVLMVLGIIEIGGVFNLGLGFALVWVGMVLSFQDDRRRNDREDQEFLWVVNGPD